MSVLETTVLRDELDFVVLGTNLHCEDWERNQTKQPESYLGNTTGCYFITSSSRYAGQLYMTLIS